ncbi:MAG: GAF domain-containing protein [Pseudomonadales bacterium]|nr:GAF domain-containing protein [Pseudomonadales bacterium]
MNLSEDFHADLVQIRNELHADFVIISQIAGTEYTVLDIASDFEVITKGQQFVTEDTFCNDVVNTGKMIRYAHVGSVHELTLHPVYTAMQLEAYLGLPLFHEDKVVGTLNFSYYDPRQPDFTDEEIEKALEFATRIESAISI